MSPFYPNATLAVHCGNEFDAGFSPYRSTSFERLIYPELGGQDMRRRDFITLFGGAAVTWPRVAYAQSRPPRVGVLLYVKALPPADLPIARELARIGYVDGRNITYVIRAAESDTSRLPRLAGELVAEKPDVIVAEAPSATVALFNVTHDVPVVATVVGDPIALGLTNSIARPNRNITGFINSGISLTAKKLQILHDVVPSLHKAGYLWAPEGSSAASFKVQIQRAADVLGIQLVLLPLRTYADIDSAFARANQEGVKAVLVKPSELTVGYSSRIVDHCVFYGLPCMQNYPFEVRNGALISYGPTEIENYSGAADYVDRILKGAKISELPFVEPTKLKLAINRRTALSLGITFPQNVLIRADEVIE
jgi:putative ABC transport system substrate-binding protein